jgi:hypothetical protein
MVPEHIHRGFLWGASTGQWPEGQAPGVPDLDARLAANGPSGFLADGIRLDAPTLFGQGATDNLFNLNQGWHNFERTLTDRARERSLLVGYDGGHALPSALPPGRPFGLALGAAEDGCFPADFGELRLAFFEAVLAGVNPRGLGGGVPCHLTTAAGGCVRTRALDERTPLEPAIEVEVTVSAPGSGHEQVDGLADDVGLAAEGRTSASLPGEGATTTGTGAPLHLELAEGPLTVAGVPTLSAEVTSVGVDQRVFAALAVGSSPATAEVVQNNMMPLREPEPVVGEARTIELPGVAVDVGEGERLYLTLSAISDHSFAHGSQRTPGAVRLSDLRVGVPLS